MMYRSPAQAREALSRWTKERNYLIDGEELTPAEDWLLVSLNILLPIKRNDKNRATKRKLIGIAKCLGLYPIPDWWAVREKILGARSRITFSDEKGRPRSSYIGGRDNVQSD